MDEIENLIKFHGTNDPKKIVAEKKITVLYENLGKQTWGYYTFINRIPVIHVNHNLCDIRINFTIAHEFIHHLKHRGLNTPFLRQNTLFSTDRIEREANQLAIRLLIGDNTPEFGETKEVFLFRCGIPEEFHIFF